MTYKIDISKKAKKFIKTLPAREALKIVQAIEILASNPRPRWVEKLKGIKKGEYYRIAWGNYRVLYTIQDEILLVCVVEVEGRDDHIKTLIKD